MKRRMAIPNEELNQSKENELVAIGQWIAFAILTGVTTASWLAYLLEIFK